MAAGHATLPAMKASPDQPEPVLAYIGVGANLGNAQATVMDAIEKISSSPHMKLMAQSSLYQTAPIESSGEDYINAVVKIVTSLSAYALLKSLQNLEHLAGRERPYINAPRTLDLDLLLYGSAKIDSETLTVPHPRMRQRAFILLPLQEIAPELVSSCDLLRVADQRIQPKSGS
jgi:2-amino-4-hydroxy-6-hydroxymethyldihydropteridine diphosphokinase